MIIIGEKINGTRKAVARAIRERDAAFIHDLAKSQADAGSAFLDVNAGTAPEREPEDMAWLVTTIQESCNTPLCLDSANPAALKAGLELVKHPPLINSVSGERPRIEGVLPLALQYRTSLILLALDDETGIPDTSDGRMRIVDRRGASFARIASFMSSVILALSVMRGLQSEEGANRFAPSACLGRRARRRL